MAVDSIIQCFSCNLVLQYCHGLESSAVNTVTPFVVNFLYGRLNRSLPHLPLHMDAEDIFPKV
jgi:hypothetical protein